HDGFHGETKSKVASRVGRFRRRRLWIGAARRRRVAAVETAAKGSPMIPGEIIPEPGDIDLNVGRQTLMLDVVNTGDRPIQTGSHYHFAEVNAALLFDRPAARGYRLNIPAGTAVRF